MNNTNQNNMGDGLNILLKGIVIGGILGVLFAPQKGEITRRQLKQKLIDTSDDLTSKKANLQSSVENVKENFITSVEGVKEQITNKLQDTQQNIGDKINEKKEDIKNKIEDIEKKDIKNI